MFREKGIFTWSDVETYRQTHNNSGLYTSVFRYDSEDLDRTNRLGSLYFDLDSADDTVAQAEAIKLVEYLRDFIPESAIRIYFTGLKGFHIECEAVALGVGANPKLADIFRYIAKELSDILQLTTVDAQCYDGRRMWRLPHSRHQKTGLYKVGISWEQLNLSMSDIKDFAKEPHFEYEVPQQEFDAKANEWYREFMYKKEVQQQDPFDRIRRFESMGTGMIVQDYESDIEFDPVTLFQGCPALMRHWETAERTHHLTHEARLFLCSMLTYTEEAERYLHQILSNTSDYTPHLTQAHIDDWKRRRELGIGGRPLTCRKAREWGVGCSDCDLEQKEKIETVNGQRIRTGELADPSPIRFAYRKKEKDNGSV